MKLIYKGAPIASSVKKVGDLINGPKVNNVELKAQSKDSLDLGIFHYCTQEEYNLIKEAGEVSPNTIYIIEEEDPTEPMDYHDLVDKPKVQFVELVDDTLPSDLSMFTRDEVAYIIASMKSVVTVTVKPLVPLANTLYYVGPNSEGYYDVYLYDKNVNEIYLGDSKEAGAYVAGTSIAVDQESKLIGHANEIVSDSNKSFRTIKYEEGGHIIDHQAVGLESDFKIESNKVKHSSAATATGNFWTAGQQGIPYFAGLNGTGHATGETWMFTAPTKGLEMKEDVTDSEGNLHNYFQHDVVYTRPFKLADPNVQSGDWRDISMKINEARHINMGRYQRPDGKWLPPEPFIAPPWITVKREVEFSDIKWDMYIPTIWTNNGYDVGFTVKYRPIILKARTSGTLRWGETHEVCPTRFNVFFRSHTTRIKMTNFIDGTACTPKGAFHTSPYDNINYAGLTVGSANDKLTLRRDGTGGGVVTANESYIILLPADAHLW